MIRALLWAPAVSPFGGHIVQMSMTAKHLNLGGRVLARMTAAPEPDLKDSDVVHGFGLSRAEVRRVRTAGLPVVLSPVYWAKDYRLGVTQPRSLPSELGHRLRAAAVLSLAAARGDHHDKAERYVSWVIETASLYESADLLLPNSASEAEQLRRDLHVSTPQRVVPNAVDEASFTPSPERPRDGVLMVGRVEPHKNQLGLIRSMRGMGIPLTIVGAAHPAHERYLDRCVREGRGHVRFLPALPHGVELANTYARFRVHALPSYFETTGLVSLEAGLMGCNVVTTSRGYATEYFSDLAWYCDPDDPSSIRQAVVDAYNAPLELRLRARILERYTWTRTAEETATAYAELVGTGA